MVNKFHRRQVKITKLLPEEEGERGKLNVSSYNSFRIKGIKKNAPNKGLGTRERVGERE